MLPDNYRKEITIIYNSWRKKTSSYYLSTIIYNDLQNRPVFLHVQAMLPEAHPR